MGEAVRPLPAIVMVNVLFNAVLLGLMLVAAGTDLRDHRVYNWLTYPGIIAGFMLSFLVAGWPGLEESVKGFAACGGVMLVCFVLFNIGGGDVKLIAMLGAFLGLQRGLEAMLWTFVLGSAMAICLLIWQVGLWRLIAGSARHLYLSLRSARWLPLTEDERRRLQPPLYLAPAALLASILVQFDLLGRL